MDPIKRHAENLRFSYSESRLLLAVTGANKLINSVPRAKPSAPGILLKNSL
jgi:hypothetical protein